MALTTAPVELVSLDGSVTINDSSADVDFRIESNGNQHMLFVDAGNDHVNIGTSSDFGGVLNVNGGAVFDDATTLDPDTMGNGRLGLGQIADGGGFASPGLGFGGTGGNTAAIVNASGTLFFGLGDKSNANSLKSMIVASQTEISFNEDSLDADFRVESDGSTHALFLQASDSAIGINNSSPTAKLHIVEATSTPAVKIKSGTSTNQNTHITMFNDDDGGTLALGVFGSSASTFGPITAGDAFVTANQELVLNSQNSSGVIKFGVGSTPSEAMRIDSSGRLLIKKTTTAFGTVGTRIDGNNIQITEDGAAAVFLNRLSSAGKVIELYQDSSVKGEIGVDAGGITINESSANLDFRVETDGNSNALVVESGQNCVIVGSQTAENRLAQPFAVTSAGARGGMVINSFHNSDSGPILDFQVSRNTTAGSHTVVQDGDALGTLIFRGDDGDEFRDSAAIEARVDGTPGNNDMPGELAFLTTASSSLAEHMVIKSDGKVGIGTNTPAYQFEVSNSSHATMRMSAGSNSSASIRLQNDVAHWDVNAQTNDNFAIYDQANGMQPFTILAGSSQVVVNETSNDTDFRVESDADALMFFIDAGNSFIGIKGDSRVFSSAEILSLNCGGSAGIGISTTSSTAGCLGLIASGTDTTRFLMRFDSGSGNVGTITHNGSNTAYNTSSDERLKENIKDADDAGELIDSIQVRQFDWKVDGEHQRYGMIAQELNTVAPEACAFSSDPEEMAGVDYSRLVPMLIKEIQSLRNRLAKLEGE